jgi:histidyl-tRNA synthetase
MRDFFPEDMALRDHIFGSWQQAERVFGFSRYDASVVESLPLLQRKAGEEIVEQIYAFKDKKGRDLALRPEMTPTLARMVAQRQSSLEFPVKWSTIAQCFRYERMTRGRKREHFQWNLDVVGETSQMAEAEVIAAAVHSMEIMGLSRSDFIVLVNSRLLISELLQNAGINSDSHPGVFMVLDKKGKVDDSVLKDQMKDSGMSESQVRAAFNVFEISSLEEAASVLGPDSRALDDIQEFFTLAEAYNIADRIRFDISVVRGLAYYTGIVFEAFDVNRDFRAIFGGGRYDNLLKAIGGQRMTGAGLGFGDVVIAELLKSRGVAGATPGAETVVGFMTEQQRDTAVRVATALRSRGGCVNVAFSPEKAGKFFSKAGKSAALKAIYIGPDDVASGTVKMKDLHTQQETMHQIEELTK